MALGWIKLHRCLLDWEWNNEPLTMALFIHILLKASHQDITWHGIEIKKGQAIIGRKELSVQTGISEQSCRTSLNRLKSTNEITITSTNKYSIITIVNWEKYQEDNQQTNQQLTSNQPATNHIQEYNNIITKEDNKDIIVIGRFKKPSCKEILDYCKERKNQVDANRFFDYYEANGWKVGKNSMKDWKACIRTWEKTNQLKTNNNGYSKSYGSDIPL